jgi:hypothetical protein
MEGITKQLVFSGSKGVTARVTVKEDYNIEKNTSSLTVSVDLACSSYYGHIYYLGGELKVAGQTLWSTSSSSGANFAYIQKLDTYYPIKDSATDAAATWTSSAISHEQDGSKTISVSFEVYGAEQNKKGAHGFTISGTSNVTLTQIPRASAIGATDANIGSVSTVSVSRKSTAYQHSVAYSFGGLSGYLTSSGGISTSEQKFTATSIPFTVPTSFYAQIPNNKTGVCTLTCRTYSGSTQIGSATTCQFTATASADQCSPTVIGTVKDSNTATVAVTGNDSVMVRYMSNALCTISASARNSASLVAKAINGTIISGDTLTVEKVSDSQIRFAAKDSRGYITDIPVSFDVIRYVLLTCVASVERTDPTSGNARLTIKGNYFSGSFGKTSNSLSINYTLNGTTVSLSPTISDNTYTASADLTGLDYQTQYNISVSVADKLSTVNTSVTVKKGIPVFDWGENDFAFHVPVRLLAEPTDVDHAVPLLSSRLRTVFTIPAGKKAVIKFVSDGSAFVTCQGWQGESHGAFFYSGYGPGGDNRAFVHCLYNASDKITAAVNDQSSDNTNGVTVTNGTASSCSCCILNMIASDMSVTIL